MYHFETLSGNLFNSYDHTSWIFLVGLLEESIKNFISAYNSHMKIGLELKTAVLDQYIPLVDGCNLKTSFYFSPAETEGMSVIKTPLNIYTAFPFLESVFQINPSDLVQIYISVPFYQNGLSLFCPSSKTKLILLFMFFELDT